MKANDYNAAVAREVLVAIAELGASDVTLGDVQSVLQNAITRFENDGSGLGDAVRVAEADVEEIRFTTLAEDQLPAANVRLDELRATIQRALNG